MKNSYLFGGAIVLVILIGAGAVWYSMQSASFMNQLSQSISSLSPLHLASAQNTATTTTVVVTTHQPSPAPRIPAPSNLLPNITSFKPAEATVGSTVTIYGINFSHTANYIMFGTSSGRHYKDGSPDTQIAIEPSPTGTKLTFTVPTTGPSGILCSPNNACVAISAIRITPGRYPITVRTSAGASVVATFTVIAQ